MCARPDANTQRLLQEVHCSGAGIHGCASLSGETCVCCARTVLGTVPVASLPELPGAAVGGLLPDICKAAAPVAGRDILLFLSFMTYEFSQALFASSSTSPLRPP